MEKILKVQSLGEIHPVVVVECTEYSGVMEQNPFEKTKLMSGKGTDVKQKEMMKTNNVFCSVITIGAICLGVLLTNCGSSKQVTAKTTEPTNAQKIEQMKAEAELIKAQQELADAKAAAERAEKQRQADAAVAATNAQKQAARLEDATEQPCQIYDDAEWYTATGMRRVKQNSTKSGYNFRRNKLD